MEVDIGEPLATVKEANCAPTVWPEMSLGNVNSDRNFGRAANREQSVGIAKGYLAVGECTGIGDAVVALVQVNIV